MAEEAEAATPEEQERARMLARLEELGPEQVRSMMAHDGFPSTWRLGVHEWLAGKDRKAAKPKAG